MKTKLKPAALATLALLSGLAISAHADERKTYIVQISGEPAASYPGGVSGYAATQPAAGKVYDAHGVAAKAYLSYLQTRQRSVTSLVPNAPIVINYSTVFNGFAARLTDNEVLTLRGNANVVSITEDSLLRPTTVSTNRFLKLSTPGGVWSGTGPTGQALKGEDMVIGIVDLGVWPENLAYADHVDGNGQPTFNGGTLAYGPPPATFKGGCVAGEGFDPAKDCNNKLIGAKFFVAGLISQGYIPSSRYDFKSPRDMLAAADGGHGDHTGSTAAGNQNNPAEWIGTPVVPSSDGPSIPMGLASGVAPRARIAAYKACWAFNDASSDTGVDNGCFSSDTMAAIDQAVADGVNVINYSISGAQSTVNDVVEQAFYRAALAGVFVAAAAGNSGPGNQVAHPSPWITTVAASTHDRITAATLTLGNGTIYTGQSLNPTALPLTALIRAEDAGLGGGAASLCFSDATAASAATQVLLDPAKVAGKVVICTRGTNARVDKSLAVLNAGGVGMVFVDNGTGLLGEVHSVPTTMVNASDGAAIKTYAQTSGARGAISQFQLAVGPAPVMIGFSSRGPNLADGGVLKPDLTAPGVNVLAQVTPNLTQAQRDAVIAGTFVPPSAWATYDGTSMATPHVAGTALLIKQAHPGWSPAAIKSALMTTAYSTLDDGLTGMQNGLLPWSQGAGHIDPGKAMDPGLVYDMGRADYVRYQCLMNKSGVSVDDCNTYGSLDAGSSLNLPSLTSNLVTAGFTFTRTVTNVGSSTATYNATVSISGFTATVSPTSMTLAPGASQSYTVTLAPTAGTALNVWSYGKLKWSDGVHDVVSPLTVAAGTSLSTTVTQLTGTTASGSRLFSVKPAFSGKLGVVKTALKPVTMGPVTTLSSASINRNVLTTVCKAGSDTSNVKVYNFNVPQGALVARFALRQEDTTGPNADHDILVLYPDNTTTGYSGTTGSAESVQVNAPVVGNYRVCVAAYAGGTVTHSLSSWVVSASDTTGPKFTVLPPATVFGSKPVTIGVSWSALPAGTRGLGVLQLLDLVGLPAISIPIRVETAGQVTDIQAPSDATKTTTSGPMAR